MAFAFEELAGGDISFSGPSEVRKFRATGVPLGSYDAFDYVADYVMRNVARSISTPMGTLNIQDIQIHENTYARSYDITIPYGISKVTAGGSGGFSGAYQITVDQTGGTVNAKAGIRIAGYAAAAADIVDNGGLIGVEGDDVKGVDIPVEQTRVTVTFRHPQGILNSAYIKRVGAIVGYPNSDAFLGYAPGEVLFKGGSFAETNTEATATYQFDVSFNRANFVVGGVTITEKKGWDVLSFTYKDSTHNNGSATVPVKTVKCVEVIRPAGRQWVSYLSAFGWGGP